MTLITPDRDEAQPEQVEGAHPGQQQLDGDEGVGPDQEGQDQQGEDPEIARVLGQNSSSVCSGRAPSQPAL